MNDSRDVQKFALSVTRWVGSPASIIIHTLLFAGSFLAVVLNLIEFERMLLILTTIVSLEAIYLAIFIQMTINYQGQAIAEVEQNIDEIQEDVEEIQEDVEEISEDVDELQEDIEEIVEDDESEEEAEEKRKREQKETLETIEDTLQKLIADIEFLKKTDRPKDSKSMF